MADLKMPDINNIVIAGNLTSDPSFRKTNNGTPVANFFIASNRKFKDNNGQWRENVCFVGVVAWYKLAESCYENIKKGSAVLVDGELQSRSWRNEDGSSRNVVEIKAHRIQFLDRKGNNKDLLDPDEVVVDVSSSDDDYHEVENDQSYEDKGQDLQTENNERNEKKHPKNTEYDFGYQDFNL